MNKNNIAKNLEDNLEYIIKKIAIDSNIRPYINNPNFLEPRLYEWHQFGLLEHTKKVRKALLNELEGILKNWDLYGKVYDCLNTKIEGIEKKFLLEISMPLHDLGKIIAYNDKRVNRNHELLSKNLVSKGFLKKRLEILGLSNNHIKYIKHYIKTHDTLGKEIRDVLKHKNKLKLSYVSEKNIGFLCKSIAKKYSDVKLELGVFYICDLLGKTDIRINVKSDDEITAYSLKIEQLLKKRELSPKLKKAIMQLPINLKLGEIYLRSIL